jgi:NTP pyrophosphatase (non-canonical NTP hydrolase)
MNLNLYDYDQSEFLKNGNIQQVVWMDELAELQQAISKALRGKLDRYNMIEEVADVLICLTQLRIKYAIDDHELQQMIDYKHYRNVGRQQGEQERVYKDENLIEGETITVNGKGNRE